MDAGGDLGSAAKESTIGLEVAGSGPVSCRFFIPFSFLPCVVLWPVFHLVIPQYAESQTIFISH